MQLDKLRHVKFFAATKHGAKDQRYGNGLPYTHHLAQVADVAKRFWQENNDTLPMYSIEFLEACWLHDVVEDTDTKLKEIEEMFGETVAHLVGAVTNEKGENRKIKNALTYPKIRNAGPAAVALKLCDRIANVESGGKLVEMYRKEYEDFRRSLYTPGENEVLWKHLDGLFK